MKLAVTVAVGDPESEPVTEIDDVSDAVMEIVADTDLDVVRVLE